MMMSAKTTIMEDRKANDDEYDAQDGDEDFVDFVSASVLARGDTLSHLSR